MISGRKGKIERVFMRKATIFSLSVGYLIGWLTGLFVDNFIIDLNLLVSFLFEVFLSLLSGINRVQIRFVPKDKLMLPHRI